MPLHAEPRYEDTKIQKCTFLLRMLYLDSRASDHFLVSTPDNGGGGQRCKKWWNWGTRFPEGKLACRKIWELRRELLKPTLQYCLQKKYAVIVIHESYYYVSADNDFNKGFNCRNFEDS